MAIFNTFYRPGRWRARPTLSLDCGGSTGLSRMGPVSLESLLPQPNFGPNWHLIWRVGPVPWCSEGCPVRFPGQCVGASWAGVPGSDPRPNPVPIGCNGHRELWPTHLQSSGFCVGLQGA